MQLADCIADTGAERALKWFWQSADGEMGLRSNFGAMVAQLEGGHTGGGDLDDVEQRMLMRLEAAGRARQIRRAFENVPGAHLWILRAVFGSGARELPALGAVAPLAPYTRAALEAHAASGSDKTIEEWIVRLCHRCATRAAGETRKKRRAEERATATDRASLDAIRREGEALLRSSLSRFAASRRRAG